MERTLQSVTNDANRDLPINDVSLSARQNAQRSVKHVKVDLGKTEDHDIVPYAESYTWHPRKIAITKHGHEKFLIARTPSPACPQMS